MQPKDKKECHQQISKTAWNNIMVSIECKPSYAGFLKHIRELNYSPLSMLQEFDLLKTVLHV